MRVDPYLAREAARILAAALSGRRDTSCAAAAAMAAGAWSAASGDGPLRITLAPELFALDFTATWPEDRGQAVYARAAAARVHYEGPVRPVDLRV